MPQELKLDPFANKKVLRQQVGDIMDTLGHFRGILKDDMDHLAKESGDGRFFAVVGDGVATVHDKDDHNMEAHRLRRDHNESHTLFKQRVENFIEFLNANLDQQPKEGKMETETQGKEAPAYTVEPNGYDFSVYGGEGKWYTPVATFHSASDGIITARARAKEYADTLNLKESVLECPDPPPQGAFTVTTTGGEGTKRVVTQRWNEKDGEWETLDQTQEPTKPNTIPDGLPVREWNTLGLLMALSGLLGESEYFEIKWMGNVCPSRTQRVGVFMPIGVASRNQICLELARRIDEGRAKP